MSNPWASAHCASALFPSSLAVGEELLRVPPRPPDLPDPVNLSLTHYPPLSPVTSTVRASASSSSKARPTSPTVSLESSHPTDTEMILADHSGAPQTTESESLGSEVTVATVATVAETLENFTVLPPKTRSPLHTNKASAISSNPSPPTIPIPLDPAIDNPSENPPPVQTNSNQNPPPQPSLVERIRRFEDKTLQRLAPTTISASGRPTVLIPDAVFQKGADLHKDFIVCQFNGRPPPFSQIQSVLNFMWGKGRRLEIHNNARQGTVLVRIQSDFLRQKIVEKDIGMWPHLTGVPLDLRHQEGLSLVAGLVGEPKETDDFTKNLVSLTLSHVKVELDLSKPAPEIVEFTRESGEVVEVLVSYPWLPSTCAHCKELGHIARNCLLLPPPQNPSPPAPAAKKSSSQTPASASKRNLNPASTKKTYTPKLPSKQSLQPQNSSSNVTFQAPAPPIPAPPSPANPPSAPTLTTQIPSQEPVAKNPSLPLPPQPLIFASPCKNINFSIHKSPPDPRLGLSLKRSRSDPSLSPPISAFAPPVSNPSTSTNSRPPFPPLLLPMPKTLDSNPYSLLATDSSYPIGESPSDF